MPIPPPDNAPAALAPSRWFNIALTSLCGLFIGIPLAWLLLCSLTNRWWLAYHAKVSHAIISTEKRNPVPFPAPPISPQEWASFPINADDWMSDYLPLRDSLIQTHHTLKFNLGVSPHPKVAIGRDGWLFFSDPFEWEPLLGRRTLSDDTKTKWQYYLNHLQDKLAEKKIPFVFIVAPNKSTIYPEYLPSYATTSENRMLDEFYQYLNTNACRASTPDLRVILHQAKASAQVYWRTDTHWNFIGATHAARSVLQSLAAQNPDMPRPPDRLPDFPETYSKVGDLQAFAGISRAEQGPSVGSEFHQLSRQPPPSLTSSPLGNNRPRDSLFSTKSTSGSRHILMVHDSFGFSMRPFLSTVFEQASYFSVGAPPPADQILETARLLKADAVCFEIVERNLFLAPPTPR